MVRRATDEGLARKALQEGYTAGQSHGFQIGGLAAMDEMARRQRAYDSQGEVASQLDERVPVGYVSPTWTQPSNDVYGLSIQSAADAAYSVQN